MTARDRWASSGLVAFRLPSGFIVSGVWPAPSELIRRGLLPWTLRKAVLENAGKEVGELTDEDVTRNLEHRTRVAAAFLRGIYDDETGEWEPLKVTFEELTDGTFPGGDVEALTDFVIWASNIGPERAALLSNSASEIELGLLEPPADEETTDEQEADEAVEDLAIFRDESAGGDAQPDGKDVESGAVVVLAGRKRRSGARVPRRRRAGTEAGPREAAG